LECASLCVYQEKRRSRENKTASFIRQQIRRALRPFSGLSASTWAAHKTFPVEERRRDKKREKEK
jgi:hypothetical protein